MKAAAPSATDGATLQRFLPLRGDRFEIQADGGAPWAAELVEASALAGSAAQGRAPFALLFRAPAQPLRGQRIYRVAHPALPAMDMFLVPVQAGHDAVCYEAVFG